MTTLPLPIALYLAIGLALLVWTLVRHPDAITPPAGGWIVQSVFGLLFVAGFLALWPWSLARGWIEGWRQLRRERSEPR